MHSLNRHSHRPSASCDLPTTQERLNLFHGQLLAARDLQAEQDYHMSKHRQHNRYLHGYGAVCGLKVTQHPNPDCRDRIVVIEPGLALDCHGREIVVREPVYFDVIEALAPQQADPTVMGNHLLLSLCYAECKTEFVPALYAECGCTETGCEANRIFEGFMIEAKLVSDDKLPKPKLKDPSEVELEWTTTLTTDKAFRVAIDPKQTRIYVLNAATPNQIMVYDTEHYCLLRSISFEADDDGRIIDLAISKDGFFLYVLRFVAEPANSDSGNYFLRVIQVKDSNTGEDLNSIRKISSTHTSGDIPLTSEPSTSLPLLAVGNQDKSGKVVTLDTNATPKKIVIWTDRINTADANPSLDPGVNDSPKYHQSDVGDARTIAISPDGSWLFIAEAGNDASSNVVKVLQITTKNVIHSIPTPIGETVSLLEVSADGLWLYVITTNGTTSKIYIFQIQETPTPFPAVNTAGVDLGNGSPIALQVSPTGKWGYVLLGTDDKGLVKAINRDKLDDPVQAITESISVTANPHDLILSPDGQHLFAAGEGAANACGGVSVINVSEDQCKDLFWRSLEYCPECVEACIPLAVVKDYRDNNNPDITDSRINNRIRPLVTSTETLQQLILCALNSTSKPAPPATGAGVKSASAQSVDPAAKAEASFDPVSGNINFKIPKGEKGEPGQKGNNGTNGINGEGLELGLTQIKALSWKHNTGPNQLATIHRLPDRRKQSPGIVIAFTQPVLVATYNKPFDPPNQIDAEHVFQVLVEHNLEQYRELGIICRCPVIGKVVAVEKLQFDPEGRIIAAEEAEGPLAEGAAFIFGYDQYTKLAEITLQGGVLIRLQGDFVLDENGRAIDAEFVRAELETGNHPRNINASPTNPNNRLGIQGGLFESWFWLDAKPQPREPE